MSGQEVEVREARPDEVPELLAVLVAAYGEERFDERWHQWKHVEGPWGPSVPWLARLDDEVIGTFFVLPWAMRGDGEAIDSARLVDGGTRPAAQGRGVLRSITHAGRTAWEADHRGIVTATATPTAQRVHVRNGATALDPIAHRYLLLPPGRAAVLEGDEHLDHHTPHAGLHTAWTPEALRWRFDERSRLDHRTFALRNADEPTGAVVRRVVRRHVPMLVVELSWGPLPSQRALLRSLLGRLRAVLLLAPHGPGAAPVPGRPSGHGGDTLLCAWDTEERGEPLRPLERAGYALTYADIGGVM